MIKKRYIIGKKYITPMNFGERLRKSDVSETAKFIMIDSFEIDFTKVLLY